MSWLKVMKLVKKEANGRPFVLGKGNKKARVMIIRDLPDGKKNIINQILMQTKIKRADVYITQVSKVKAVRISENEISRWIPILDEEVKMVKPEEMFILGKAAKIACFEGQLSCFPQKKTQYKNDTLEEVCKESATGFILRMGLTVIIFVGAVYFVGKYIF